MQIIKSGMIVDVKGRVAISSTASVRRETGRSSADLRELSRRVCRLPPGIRAKRVS
jgi:hypothetical protein